jgi:ClpX C4-type zinc finger
MPSGKDITGGGSSGGGKRNGGGNMSSGGTGGPKKNAYCSFCRKSYRDIGPLVEGHGDAYICGECIELCQAIIDQEKVRRSLGELSESVKSAERQRDLCRAADFLGAVSQILKNLRGKGLQPAEEGLLEEIETRVHQLRAALDARADQEASR